MKRLAFVFVILGAACTARSTPGSTSPSAHPDAEIPAPAPMPKELTRAELGSRLASGELAEIAMTEISRREVSIIAEQPPIKRPGELVISNAMPGGWSTTVYADRYRRLWIVTSSETMHVPAGVSISATRVFETRLRLPLGYRVAGTIRVVNNA